MPERNYGLDRMSQIEAGLSSVFTHIFPSCDFNQMPRLNATHFFPLPFHYIRLEIAEANFWEAYQRNITYINRTNLPKALTGTGMPSMSRIISELSFVQPSEEQVLNGFFRKHRIYDYLKQGEQLGGVGTRFLGEIDAISPQIRKLTQLNSVKKTNKPIWTIGLVDAENKPSGLIKLIEGRNKGSRVMTDEPLLQFDSAGNLQPQPLSI